MEHIEPAGNGISVKPTGAARRVGVLTVLVCGLAALAIIDTFLAKSPGVYSLDAAIVSKMYGIRLRWPWLYGPVLTVTHLGSNIFVFLFVVALALWSEARSWRVDAAWVIGTAVFARVLGWSAKLVFESPRPHILAAPAIESFSGYGFPSGHALMSMVVYGAAALLIIRHSKSKAARLTTAVTCTVLIAAIGFSRIYLGAHWANDIIGGYLYGACILASAELVRRKSGKSGTSHSLTSSR